MGSNLCLITCTLGCKIFPQKPNWHKEDIGKDVKFIEAQVIDIIVHNWFPVDPTFQVPKSNDEDDDDDISSTKHDMNVKRKGSETFSQAKPIDLDSHP